MEYAIIVAMLAVIQFIGFGALVGAARGRTGVQAPAVSGNEEFERYFRVQQNTLEQLLAFLPGIYAFAVYVDPYWAAGLGIVFLAGRQIYLRSYTKDPASRTVGFLMSFAPSVILVIGGLVGAVINLL
ncbi:MAG: MAPEG family protein [Pseudomonadales bacterium]|nr:MAPEG family protein [Pseudomonadales bacterium]